MNSSATILPAKGNCNDFGIRDARSESHCSAHRGRKNKKRHCRLGNGRGLGSRGGQPAPGTGSRQRLLVSRVEMSRIAKRLARLPVAERRKIEGIGPRRAEIVVAGAMVYHELLDRCHLKTFRYSPMGLRDGILA